MQQQVPAQMPANKTCKVCLMLYVVLQTSHEGTPNFLGMRTILPLCTMCWE